LLNSYQIAAALTARGLDRTEAKTDRTKAHGYKSESLRYPLYVRIGGPQGGLRPVDDDPLALHPDDAELLKRLSPPIPGIELRSASNPSSAYAGFPPRVVNGRVSSYEGVRASVLDEDALDRLLAALGFVASATDESEATDAEPFVWAGIEAELDSDPRCKGLGPTTRKAMIEARVGQGVFRRRMLTVWGGKCAVTGCALTKALVASHAIPWKESEAHERLDEYNGLLLTASIDRLFDKGLISFDNAGHVLIKKELHADDLACLGLAPGASLRHVHPRHITYLTKHRERFDF